MKMTMIRLRRTLVCLACLTALISFGRMPVVRAASPRAVSHVLLISLDGFHDFDLTDYVQAHPGSALASLIDRGVRYTHAMSTSPSDSFPSTLAMVTGGSPVSTGVYYDVSWDDRLSPPGSNCSSRGTTVSYNEAINVSKSVRLPALINPAALPLDPDAGCTPCIRTNICTSTRSTK